MTTKHTPGPWDYVEGKTLYHVERKGGQGAVCSVPKSREADARLIAAAPDLLEALKALSQTLSAETQAMARAAILKAEGK